MSGFRVPGFRRSMLKRGVFTNSGEMVMQRNLIVVVVASIVLMAAAPAEAKAQAGPPSCSIDRVYVTRTSGTIYSEFTNSNGQNQTVGLLASDLSYTIGIKGGFGPPSYATCQIDLYEYNGITETETLIKTYAPTLSGSQYDVVIGDKLAVGKQYRLKIAAIFAGQRAVGVTRTLYIAN